MSSVIVLETEKLKIGKCCIEEILHKFPSK